MSNRPKRPGVYSPSGGASGMSRGGASNYAPPEGQWTSTADPSANMSAADLDASSYGEEVPSSIPDASTPQTLQYTPGQMSGWDKFRNILSLGANATRQNAFNAEQQKQALLYNIGEANQRADALFNNTTALRARQDTERAGRVTDEKTQEDLLNEQAGRAIRGNPGVVMQAQKLGIPLTGVGDAQDGFLVRKYLGNGVLTGGLLSGLSSGARDVYSGAKNTALISGAPAEAEAGQDAAVTGYQADTSRNVLSRIGTDAQMPLAGDVARGAQGSILDNQRLGKLTTAQAITYAEQHPSQAQEDAHALSVANVNRSRMFDVPVGGAAVQLDAQGNPANFMQMGGMDINNPLAKPGIKFGQIGQTGVGMNSRIKLAPGQVRSALDSGTANATPNAVVPPNSTASTAGAFSQVIPHEPNPRFDITAKPAVTDDILQQYMEQQLLKRRQQMQLNPNGAFTNQPY